MNVYDIVREYLETHGYDGLAGEGCGCTLDDLAPCGHMDECVPGIKKKWSELTKEQQEMYSEYNHYFDKDDWFVVEAKE